MQLPRTIDDVLSTYKVETRRRKAKEYCYFIQRQNDNLIKIGYSSRVYERSQHIALEVKSPVTVLGVIKGGITLEKLLQRMFEASHVTGEWYEPKAELLQYIAANTEKYKPIKERQPREHKPRQPRKPKMTRLEILQSRFMNENKATWSRRRALTEYSILTKLDGIPILEEFARTCNNRELKAWAEWNISDTRKRIA